MIPLWKAKRELTRVLRQVTDLPKNLAEKRRLRDEPERIAKHDQEFLAGLNPLQGNVPLDRKVAIFLIYQPDGVVQSTLDTCQNLMDAGFAPLVISNAPVSEADRARLAPVVWQTIERPNFGYDFGGYRDGIRYLWQHNIDLDWLIVMNDSIWHFLTPARVQAWQARGADLLGILQDEKVRHTAKGSQATDLRHIESYFYLISASLWQSEDFREFWRNYRMSDDKSYTIKNGEIGMSRYLISKNKDLQALSQRAEFVERLQSVDAAFLQKTLTYAAYDDAALRNEGAAILAAFDGSAPWHAQAVDHVQRVILRRRFSSSFCYATHHFFGTLSLKKSRETIFVHMRQRYLAAIAAGDLPSPGAVIQAEMEQTAARDVAKGYDK